MYVNINVIPTYEDKLPSSASGLTIPSCMSLMLNPLDINKFSSDVESADMLKKGKLFTQLVTNKKFDKISFWQCY